jgi:6-phosphogluconolactonase
MQPVCTPTRSYLRILVVLASTLAACGGGGSSSGGGGTNPPPPPSVFLFASGTTQILGFSVNTSTGALTQTAVVPESGLTFGVVEAPSGRFLYAADSGAHGIDGLATSRTGALSAIAGSPFVSGIPPTSAVYNPAMDSSGKFLYAVDTAPSVVGFTVNGTTGALTAIPGSPFSAGMIPAIIAVDKSDGFLYVTDEGDAQGGILAFAINPSTGALTSISGSPFPTTPGGQPYDLVEHPTGKFLYAALPSYHSIAAFTINSATGSLTAVTGSPFASGASGLSSSPFFITVDPSGRFLYALNASSNEIAAFTVDSSSGALTAVAGSPFVAAGGLQGGMVVDPSGKFLYVAGGLVSAIGTFKIDSTTGALTPAAKVQTPGNVPTILTIARMP